jgi:hypothetical protein
MVVFDISFFVSFNGCGRSLDAQLQDPHTDKIYVILFYLSSCIRSYYVFLIQYL